MESSKNDDYAWITEKRSLLKMENSELPKDLSLHRGEAHFTTVFKELPVLYWKH